VTGPWRQPAAESVGLYPGFAVTDNVVAGSITLGRSRLPVWCFLVDFPEWDAYGNDEPGAPHYGVSKEHLAGFVIDLFELRGEFARLLLVMADAERCDRTGRRRPWWETKRHRRRVRAQLRRCVAVLDAEERRDARWRAEFVREETTA
jgi:hypothetical protein